jgi:hypothetical protein
VVGVAFGGAAYAGPRIALRVRLAQKVNTTLCTNSCDLKGSNKKKSYVEACIKAFGSNYKHNTK